MKLMKIIICVLLITGLLLSLSACVLDKNIKVDKDGNVKINGEDGEIEIGKTKWDTQKVYGLSSPDAKLESYVSTEDGVFYTFSDMKEADAKEYINKIKEAGFTYNAVLLNDYNYTGTNKDGKLVSFLYDKETGNGTITAGEGEKPSEEDNNEEAIVGGTDHEWDSGKMGGLPDPGTKIISYWSVDGDTCYTFEEPENYQDYVEEIKECGFTVNPSEAEVNDSYNYTASNDNEDIISFTVSNNECCVTFEKNG